MSDDRVFCRPCTCERCRRNYMDKFCSISCFESGNALIDDITANYLNDYSNSSDHPPQHQTHSFESYNDNPNYGYPPQEPFVYNQNSCYEQNFIDNSQSPPQPQYEMNSCELCGNNAHYGYDCPPHVPFVYNQNPCFNQDFDNNFSQTSPSFPQQYLCCENREGLHATFQCQPMNQNYITLILLVLTNFNPRSIPSFTVLLKKRKPVKDLQIINEELAEYINSPSWNRPAFYDDDDDEYSIQVSEKSPIVIAPKEPDNSLNIGNGDLDTILETKSDEAIKYSVEDLVPTPSESEGILDNMCDVPFSDKNRFDAEYDLIESLLTRDTSIVYSPKINSLLEEFAGELAHIDPIPSGIDETDYDLKDDILFIEQLLYDDTSSEDDSFKDIEYVEASPPDSELLRLEETFSDHTEERSSGSTTTHANNSLFKYDSFHFEIEPDQGELSRVAMEAILGEPRVYVPTILPTHITLLQDLDFSSSDDSLGSDL
nr:hypothetical protein [Tanacetum cinerariifolium]